MGFKLKPSYVIDNTPIYRVTDEDGVVGRATKSGVILINKNVKDPKLEKQVICHEKVHIDQMKKGLITYDDKYMYHRKSSNQPFKKIKRSKKADGNPNHWWEKQAYNKCKYK
jgi:hypothetical protein|tara:strand:+ start:700 stop:1035 length:336 start_codon:yes stop_codon:yes gene_type:complete